jgi:hypothetical protein
MNTSQLCHFSHEDRDGMILQNIGINLQNHTASIPQDNTSIFIPDSFTKICWHSPSLVKTDQQQTFLHMELTRIFWHLHIHVWRPSMMTSSPSKIYQPHKGPDLTTLMSLEPSKQVKNQIIASAPECYVMLCHVMSCHIMHILHNLFSHSFTFHQKETLLKITTQKL